MPTRLAWAPKPPMPGPPRAGKSWARLPGRTQASGSVSLKGRETGEGGRGCPPAHVLLQVYVFCGASKLKVLLVVFLKGATTKRRKS